jgi:von Willebrand factor type A domain
MIIAANIDFRKERVLEDRSADARRLELQVDVGRRNLVRLREAVAVLMESMANSDTVRGQIVAEIRKTEEELKKLLEDEETNSDEIEQLRADLAALQRQTEILEEAEAEEPREPGEFLREVRGEGYRQYLTGLRMGGQHILILVDVSTSMLDSTLVNILRRRNMSEAQQRRSPKWQQIVKTVDWLTAQLKPGMQFQVIAFNDKARSLIDGTDGQWLTATDGSTLQKAVDTLGGMIPSGPTSLHAAFEAASQLQPKPDNIYLLVDGLPTMGEVTPSRPGVTGRERLRHFERAIREAPLNVPINVLLYPMEGDPLAAPSYWTLALRTGGSMMAPSPDWP